MASQVPQILSRVLIILLIASLAMASARPSHFGDVNQVASEPGDNNLLDSGLKPWQLEVLAQRLSEMGGQTGEDYGWERAIRERGIRSPESKRQSRYRQCYFNPISCFRK